MASDSDINEDRARGIALQGEGRFEEAIEVLVKVVRRDSRDVVALTSLAQCLYQAGRVREASARLVTLAKLLPGDPVARRVLANTLIEQDRFREAVDALRESIAIAPNYLAAQVDLGNLSMQLGRTDEAETCYRNAIAIDPANPVPLSNLAAVLMSRGDRTGAQQLYREALARDPRHADAANGLGAALLATGDAEAALVPLRDALAVRPDHAFANLNLARALRESGRADEAVAHLRRLIDGGAAHVELHDELALAFRAIDDHTGALAEARRAVTLDATHPDALIHLGNLLADANDLAGAESSYRQALRFAAQSSPQAALARWNLALAELARGHFGQGWADYEARWHAPHFPSPRRHFDAPRLARRADARGKRVLVHAEQGFGDTLQFVRLVPHLAEQGATVVLEVQPSLVRLLAGLPGASEVVAHGAPLPAFDAHVPLLSLPLLLDRPEPDAAGVPYLPVGTTGDARPATPSRPKRVGIVWRGGRALGNDRRRSLDLEIARPLFGIPGIEWIGLQPDLDADRAVLDALRAQHPGLIAGATLDDFTTTAAQVESLDLVISVDTAVAHLAGAMGRPVWVLLLYAPDFRWMLEREDSPWYPSARLFRQPQPGRWDRVIEDVVAALVA